ncbi:hypothetical protein HNY73_011009 [Argiope bruennichi]|uniref:Uncharacterized protein n=1 Tax=Argiope bruennichi TaxID=94029 RepID=A0A8T0F2U4_ARGBR|nr:hypothetical protein HNY73_011009 [Argiope bruennichi]
MRVIKNKSKVTFILLHLLAFAIPDVTMELRIQTRSNTAILKRDQLVRGESVCVRHLLVAAGNLAERQASNDGAFLLVMGEAVWRMGKFLYLINDHGEREKIVTHINSG